VICVGFDGASAASAPIDALRAFGPGAVILFGRNAGSAEQTRELVAALRGISELAPLIAVDQEGGRVERLHDGVAPLPSAMAFGATGDVDLVARAGSLLGRDLARLGITAGASAPETLVDEIIEAFAQRFAIKVAASGTQRESIVFNLPRELRVA